MKNTKIICTLGPSSSSVDVLKEMINSGMNVARFNMSHGTHQSHSELMDAVRKARAELNAPVAILVDTKGPEIRVRDFADGGVTLVKGKKFTLTTLQVVGDIDKVSVSYSNLPKLVRKGTSILLNDGNIELSVLSTTKTEVVTKVVVGGYLSNKKSINIPSVDLDMPYISEQDQKDIEFACKQKADYLAISFVNKKEDVIAVKKLLAKFGRPSIKIISKIESRLGVQNAHEILEESDGIMVARGDLGVEVDFAKIPIIQKQLIAECNTHGKIVVTATQMMESMTTASRPTRAEISDVANAIMDGTTAIMLSGESSAGKHPALVVNAMNRIASEIEQTQEGNEFAYYNPEHLSKNGGIAYGVVATCYGVNADGIIVLNNSDMAYAISNYKPIVNTYSFVNNCDDYYQSVLYFGVVPVLTKSKISVNDAISYLKSEKCVKKNNKIIVVDNDSISVVNV